MGRTCIGMVCLAVLLMCLGPASCCSSNSDPLCGKWSGGPDRGKVSTFLTLSANGTFSLGDLQDNREQLGFTGTWTAEKETLLLKVKTSESCKIKEGQTLRLTYRLSEDGQLVLSEANAPENKLLLRKRQ